MKGHFTSYKQENIFLIKFRLFIIIIYIFKIYNKAKYLQHKPHSQGGLRVFK
jgi:hypothetical protein